MTTTIILMLCVYIILFTLAWFWFFKKEKSLCEKLYTAGLKAFDAKNFKKAKKYFSKIVFLNANYEDARYKLGITNFELKKLPEAKDCFENILKDTPKFFDALFYLGQILRIQKEYKKAEETINKALEENEKSHDCHFELGIILIGLEDYQKALESFKKAEELGSGNKLLPFYINKCNQELCDFDDDEQVDAIIKTYLALELAYKDNIPPGFNKAMANTYARHGNVDKALEYTKKSLLNNSEDVESYKLLALIQYSQKDYAGAKNSLSTALHLQPKDKELHTILSYSLCQDVDDCPLQKCREKYQEVMKKFLN